MLPLAPARLSTTTCWPHTSLSFCETTRATMSVAPPGENGTITRTGFVGKGAGAEPVEGACPELVEGPCASTGLTAKISGNSTAESFGIFILLDVLV
jgi:hypothetical protein